MVDLLADLKAWMLAVQMVDLSVDLMEVQMVGLLAELMVAMMVGQSADQWVESNKWDIPSRRLCLLDRACMKLLQTDPGMYL